ncbi:MAG: NmrA/HSCARG family protein [Dehalococcoidia bacterium]|nr:NmrA/HSCARG family protein [Dehalococcoidia bacterium]
MDPVSRTKGVLALGATGKQGGAAARSLKAKGWQVRALTRDPMKREAVALRNMGIEVLKGDFSDKDSLEKAVAGVYGVFAVTTGRDPNVEAQQGILMADIAKAAGVKHYVFTSANGAGVHSHMQPGKTKVQDHLKTLGMPYTILAPVFFMENFNSQRPAIIYGTLMQGYASDKKFQYVAVEDIGEFAALALEKPGQFVDKLVDLASDEFTLIQAAETIGKVIGRPVKYVQEPIEQIRSRDASAAQRIEWFNQVPYNINISELRKMHPGLLTLEQWLIKNNWTNLAVKKT